MNLRIRKAKYSDIPHLKEVLNTIELFPAEMLEEMMADYLENQESQEIWLTAVENEIPIALTYCAPDKLTEGTFNLYAIGVKGDIQGKGIGAKLMTFLEKQLQAAGHRILIVDTSGTADFEFTRRFYEKLNYHKEAVIRDFWADGDDKVTYWKRLN